MLDHAKYSESKLVSKRERQTDIGEEKERIIGSLKGGVHQRLPWLHDYVSLGKTFEVYFRNTVLVLNTDAISI